LTKFIRRLQKIGSTILVSLPKEWVDANNLDKSIPVELETGHNTISITVNKEKKTVKRSYNLISSSKRRKYCS